VEFGGDAVAAALGLTGATPAGVVGELIEVGDDAIPRSFQPFVWRHTFELLDPMNGWPPG